MNSLKYSALFFLFFFFWSEDKFYVSVCFSYSNEPGRYAHLILTDELV
jgi:hypothetical protein